MENRQDVRNIQSLYKPRFSLYIAEALATEHQGCAHLLSSTPQHRPALCRTCRGMFYLETGIAMSGDGAEGTASTAVQVPRRQHQDQDQAQQQMQEQQRRLETERHIKQQQDALDQAHKQEEKKLVKLVKRKMAQEQKQRMLEQARIMEQRQARERENLRVRQETEFGRDQANVQAQVTEEDQAGDDLHAQDNQEDGDL